MGQPCPATVAKNILLSLLCLPLLCHHRFSSKTAHTKYCFHWVSSLDHTNTKLIVACAKVYLNQDGRLISFLKQWPVNQEIQLCQDSVSLDKSLPRGLVVNERYSCFLFLLFYLQRKLFRTRTVSSNAIIWNKAWWALELVEAFVLTMNLNYSRENKQNNKTETW